MSKLQSKPTVAVVRSEGHYEGTKKALELIESQVANILKGKRRVLIKPNLVSANRELAVTHVDSVRAVLDVLSRHYSGKFTVGEGPALGRLEDAISNFGYRRLEDEYGVRFLDLNRDEYVELEGVDSGLRTMRFRVAKTLVESDFVVSVTKPKTHDCVVVTLSIKNVVVGGLLGGEKSKVHQGMKAMNINIARLAKHLMPSLGIIDGYVGMEGAGPVYGEQVNLGVSAASIHPVSLDAVMAKIMGFEPMNIGYLHHLNSWGVGIADLDEIEVLGERVDKVSRRFKPHPRYEEQLKWR
ncbi:MAG: DUF362 domain-containing protein [Candidatus Bathyarchaeia archaeon]